MRIVKFNPEGKVLLVLGRRRESLPGLHDFQHPYDHPTPPAQPTVFNEPTEITWDPQANIFISDGYKNMSVAKLDENGAWVTRIGKGNMAERGDGPGEFNNPHGIAAEAQVFDSNLKFLRQTRS